LLKFSCIVHGTKPSKMLEKKKKFRSIIILKILRWDLEEKKVIN
jgi:hypothetical protein